MMRAVTWGDRKRPSRSRLRCSATIFWLRRARSTATAAEVSKAGDLAYTQGVYTLIVTDRKTKKPVTEKGTYVTVYKKQADGSWKAVADMATAGPPAAPAK